MRGTGPLLAPFTIRRCASVDAVPISALAARLFVQAYGVEYAGPELEPYLVKSFDAERLAEQLSDGENVFALAVESSTGEQIGYALMSASLEIPHSVTAEHPLEIQRFYVDSAWHGKGVAQSLMHACIERAEQWGADAIWLSVWQEAPRPQTFYTRMGFGIVGTTAFHFGTRVDDDYVMVLPLKRVSPTAG